MVSTALEKQTPVFDIGAAVTWASQSKDNIEVLERLYALQERKDAQDRKAQFAGALHAVQGKRLRVFKRKAAKNNRYAPLEDIDSVLTPVLQEYGLSVSFDCPSMLSETVMQMQLTVYHNNGYSEPRTLPVPLDDIGKNREGNRLRPLMQDYGSTVSYARRYLLKMTFNVVETDEDDDANGGGGGPITQKQADDIRDLAESIGIDKVGFFRWLKIDSFEQIPAGRYGEAWAKIEAKRR